jgi:hypothetical protein
LASTFEDDTKYIVVSGLKRAASTLLFNVVRLSVQKIYLNPYLPPFCDFPGKAFLDSKKKKLNDKSIDCAIIHTHDLENSVLLRFNHTFSCYRNPKDALLSAHRKYYLNKKNSIIFLNEYISQLNYLHENDKIITRFPYQALVNNLDTVISKVYKLISNKENNNDIVLSIKNDLNNIKSRNIVNNKNNLKTTKIDKYIRILFNKFGKSYFENTSDRLHPGHISPSFYVADKKFESKVLNNISIKKLLNLSEDLYLSLLQKDKDLLIKKIFD